MQTEHIPMKNDQLDTVANPPPQIEVKRDEPHLFQTMHGLSVRHGRPAGKGERALHTAGAILACLVLTSLLYVAILFVE